MTTREIRTLVGKGENQKIEFKRKVAHPQKVLKEIVAFANAQGGVLLIGVDDQGNLPGIYNAKEEAFLLDEAILNHIRPRLKISRETIHLSRRKMLLLYTIPESKNKPHYVISRSTGNNKIAYLRIRDMSVKASNEVREILKHQSRKQGIHFNYGEKEEWLLKYLDHHDSITLDQFIKEAELDRKMASKTLVVLVLANLLDIVPGEKEDLFKLKEN